MVSCMGIASLTFLSFKLMDGSSMLSLTFQEVFTILLLLFGVGPTGS